MFEEHRCAFVFQQLCLSLPPSLQLSVCKELQLPTSEYSYSADLVDITSAAPLETAGVQSVSVLAVAAEGTSHWWPSLAQEGNYTETEVDLGDLCNYVVAVTVGLFTFDSPLQCTLKELCFFKDMFSFNSFSGREFHRVLSEKSTPEGESRCFWEAAVPSLDAGSGNAVWNRTPDVQPVWYPLPSRQ